MHEDRNAQFTPEALRETCVVRVDVCQHDGFDILWITANLCEASQQPAIVARETRVDDGQPPALLDQIPVEGKGFEVVDTGSDEQVDHISEY